MPRDYTSAGEARRGRGGGFVMVGGFLKRKRKQKKTKSNEQIHTVARSPPSAGPPLAGPSLTTGADCVDVDRPKPLKPPLPDSLDMWLNELPMLRTESIRAVFDEFVKFAMPAVGVALLSFLATTTKRTLLE